MQRRVMLVLAAVAVAAALTISAIAISQSGQAPRRNSIAVTWGLLGEIAHRLTDGQVEIIQILPPGAELHHWEPTPDVIQLVRNSAVLLWTVEGLDDWGKRIAASTGVKGFRVATKINFLKGGHHHHGHGHSHDIDLHFWHNPQNVAQLVKNIADVLVNIFPDRREQIENNKKFLVAELEQLDRDISTKLSPYKGRIFITQHDAFRYLAEAYGLITFAVFTAHEEEPDAAHLAELYEIIEKNKIKVIFAEDDRVYPLVSTLAKDKGLRIAMLYTGEDITTDGYKTGRGYFDIMRKNVEALIDAFTR